MGLCAKACKILQNFSQKSKQRNSKNVLLFINGLQKKMTGV